MGRYIKITESNTGDLQSTEGYNAAVKKWGSSFRGMVKRTAGAFSHGKLQQRGETTHTYKRGPKAGKTEGRLVNELKMKYHEEAGEIDIVGLKLARHGIFRELGVGNGTPKRKRGMTRRTASPWLSEPLEMKQGELADIVAEHEADLVLRVFRFKGE